jgi:hypothetical protein
MYSGTHYRLIPSNPPPPRIWAHVQRALLVSQDIRHLLVTSCLKLYILTKSGVARKVLMGPSYQIKIDLMR